MLLKYSMFHATRLRFLTSPYHINTNGLLWSRRQWYALSRFPERNPGVSRHRSRIPLKVASAKDPTSDSQHPCDVASNDSDSLRGLLFRSNTLVVERQIEMLNVFVGFEQSNKYTISTKEGEALGYIAEDSKTILGTLSRQFFATHRPFRAVIMDKDGNPILFLRRPFAWINSRMFVQRMQDQSQWGANAETTLDTFGEVQQIWHPWRRKYDLFLRGHTLSSSEISGPQDTETVYHQVAQVDAGFLAWHFRLVDESKAEIASIDREFRGIGREIFTDTGRYEIHFAPREMVHDLSLTPDQQTSFAREVNLDERALFLALAVNIDFDYFSRHSHVGGGGIFHFSGWD